MLATSEKELVPGLLDPVDGQTIISPGEIAGGDSIVLFSSLAVWDHVPDIEDSGDKDIGLVQGLSFGSSRAMRQIYQVGQVDPVLISSVGQKTLSMSSIISEETNLLRALYRAMVMGADAMAQLGYITPGQEFVLNKYKQMEIPEGLPRDLMRIPFGLILMILSGEGDLLEAIHLGHCLVASDSTSVEAGTRGVGGANTIMWQKTTYITDYEV